MQILTDSGYNNVLELSGGFDAWVKAGYPVVGKQPISDGEFTSITGHFTLDSKDTAGTLIPYGSVIYHWRNGITEVRGPDNGRLLLVRDAEAPTITMQSGTSKPATFIYKLPAGTTVDSGEGELKNETRFLLDGKVILTVISKFEELNE